MKYINQMEPHFDEMEREALNEYMLSNAWVTEFDKTREFENMIASFTGARYCSVVSNGTMALVTALLACGIKKGDEVIVPDFTMVATPNSAELIGATAVFADIEKDTLCIDFDSVKNVVTPKTKAIIIVSLNGRYPNHIEELIAFCKEKGIMVIEDAAQSLGSCYQNRQIGTFGDVGCFSFSAPKIITTGQGGALITESEEIYSNIKKIRDFGRQSSGNDHYLSLGWNFKFTDIQAVIGIEQMKKLAYRVKRKKEMGVMYSKLLKGIKGVITLDTDYTQTCLWFFDILCKNRENLIAFLKKRCIGTRRFYPALHKEPVYNYLGLSFSNAERVAEEGLWLPSAITLTNEEIEYICKMIKVFYNKDSEEVS